MKTKKILLIPSAMLCLAALASCGKTQSRFTNGFESPELERYFNLPKNLKVVAKEYGEYVYEQSFINANLANSAKTTLQIAGSDAFFDSLKRGTTTSKLSTPFSPSSMVIHGTTEVKKYDDEYPVTTMTEKSYRSKIDANGQSSSSFENDFTYLSYIEPEDENKLGVYTVTKGTSSLLAGGSFDPGLTGLTYKTKVAEATADQFDQLKVLFKDKENKAILKNAYISAPLLTMAQGGMKANSVFNRYCTLKGFDLTENSEEMLLNSSRNPSRKELIKSNLNFYLDGNKTIYANLSTNYEEGYVPSRTFIDKVKEGSLPKSLLMEYLIPAYNRVTMTAKMTLHSDNQWYCDNIATNLKIFVGKDENLNNYSTPRCLCSEYYCTDLNYESCGNYGAIEKVDAVYSATKYGVGVDIYDGDDASGYYHDVKQSYIYDGANDSTLDHIGGIYDYTMTFRALGLIPEIDTNKRVFYGTFDVSDTETIEIGEDETISVSSIDLKVSLLDKEDETTIDLLSDTSVVKIEEENLEIKEDSSNWLHVISTGATYEFVIYITLKDDGSLDKLDSIEISKYSSMSSPSYPAEEAKGR